MIPGRLRVRDSRSEAAFERVHELIEECEGQHSCGYKESPLPTRVVDLEDFSSSETGRILETNGQQGRYIALSHCWGLSQLLQH